MGTSKSRDRAPGSDASIDTDADRYPDAKTALSRISNDLDFPSSGVERIEIRFLANGEGVYRIWEPRAEEPTDQGLLPPP